MEVRRSDSPDQTLTVILRSDEVVLFRAALERASFVDTRPELQGAVIDFVQRLLDHVPED